MAFYKQLRVLVPAATAVALALACSATGVTTPDDEDSGTASSSGSSGTSGTSGTVDSGKKETGSSSGTSGTSGTSGSDAATQKDTSVKETSTPGVCPAVPTAADYAAHSKPPIAGGNCTPAEISTFADDINDPNNTTWGDVRTLTKTNVSAACASCLFTDEADATWGAIVMRTADPDTIIANWGACLQRYAGAPAACATAYQQYWQCGSIACEACTPASVQDQCFQDHYDPGGLCDGAPKTAMNTTCGAALSLYEADCDGQAQSNLELVFNHAAGLCSQ